MVKKNILAIYALLFVSLGFSQELSWKIQDPRTNKWIPLGVKGSVQEAYITNGILPDPFVGENEKLFAWIENYNWTFEATLNLDSIKQGFEYDLDFPSIDTYASIYVNDVLCGSAENSFVHYYFSVKELLRKGENKIRVVFQSPVNAKKKEAEAFVYPAPNDVGKIKVAPYCRKPQYQFGWDWSLRMTTIGFWEPASLIGYEENRAEARFVKTEKVTKSSADLSLVVRFRNQLKDSTYIWESQLFGTHEQFSTGSAFLIRTGTIQNPILWWPRGQGEQHLYTDVWTIKTIDGNVIYQDTIQFGIRTSKVVQEEDQWGTSFVIHVNDRPMFCKGADYIPDNIFPAKITDERLRNSVRTMAESNFNMVRIWGGGMYAKEAFLEECDKLGIMVWHDFMFACAMYPADSVFLKNVSNELEQQIPRIATHPSLVYFNGNNEVDVAWKNWGFQQTFNLSKTAQAKIAADYDKLFKNLIPGKVTSFTNIPYVHTSPLSNWGNDEFYNHGTQHYWGVWHGKDPMSNMGTKIGRFNAEYGFQSFPEYSTLLQFSKKSEWSLESANMKQHQKSYVGNSMIAKHADLLFGKVNNFEDFVYFSQLTQAEAVETAVNAHRIDKPRCSGTLFWQYNDCWPAISWSSVDYYGNWKALQYRIKSSYEDVAILKDKTNPGLIYHLVSDIPTGYLCEINCEISNLEGKVLAIYNCHRAVLNESSRILENELAPFQNENCFVKLTWTKESGELLYFNDLHIVNEVGLNKSSVQLSDLIVDETARKGTLQVTSSAIARDFWIYSTLIGVHFTNNFVLLQSGRHEFEFTYTDKKPELLDLAFKFR